MIQEDEERIRIVPHQDDGKKDGKKSSAFQAYLTFVNAFVGGGILGLPYGIREGGLYLSLGALIIVAFISAYTLRILGETKTRYAGGLVIQYYTDIGFEAFGRPGLWMVNIAIIISQFGFCSVYLIFIGDNIFTLLPKDTLSAKEIVAITGALVLFLVFIRKISYLSFSSILGNLAIFLVVIVVFKYGFTKEHIKPIDDYPDYNLAGFPIFYGIVAFSFTVHSLALEVHTSMRKPSQYSAVVNASTAVVTIIYIGFGGLAYLFFGNHTAREITLDLNGSVAGAATKIALCTVLICAYPLQMYPIVRITEEKIFPPPTKSWIDTLKRDIYRVFLVGVTIVLGVEIPFFALVSSFIGSFSNSFIAFIFPPLFYAKLFWKDLKWYQRLTAIVVVIVGLAGMAVGSIVSMLDIIGKIEKEH